MNVVFAVLFGLMAPETPAVANPGFETISERTGLPSDWSFTSLPNQSRLAHYEAKAVRDGQESQALFISVAADHPARSVAYNAHQDVRGCVAGKTYRVTAKVRTQGLRTLPMVVIQCLDESEAKNLAFARSPQRSLNGDIDQWESIQTEVTVPEQTSTFRLRIGIPSEGNAGGTAIIDDIEIVEVE